MRQDERSFASEPGLARFRVRGRSRGRGSLRLRGDARAGRPSDLLASAEDLTPGEWSADAGREIDLALRQILVDAAPRVLREVFAGE
jgi:hypothetical protein